MAADEVDVAADEPTSRRRILKRAALGGAAAWAVPTVFGTSVSLAGGGGNKCASAAALDATNPNPCTICPACNRQCGKGAGGCCFTDVKGCCFCGVSGSCSDTGCTSNSDCPPGYRCAYTCCSVQVQCVQIYTGTVKRTRTTRGRQQGRR